MERSLSRLPKTPPVYFKELRFLGPYWTVNLPFGKVEIAMTTVWVGIQIIPRDKSYALAKYYYCHKSGVSESIDLTTGEGENYSYTHLKGEKAEKFSRLCDPTLLKLIPQFKLDGIAPNNRSRYLKMIEQVQSTIAGKKLVKQSHKRLPRIRLKGIKPRRLK